LVGNYAGIIPVKFGQNPMSGFRGEDGGALSMVVGGWGCLGDHLFKVLTLEV